MWYIKENVQFCAFGNAPLVFKTICKTLLILLLFCNLLFLFIHSKLLFSKILLLKKTISVNDYWELSVDNLMMTKWIAII